MLFYFKLLRSTLTCSTFIDIDGNNTDEDLEDIDPEDPEVNEETDLLLKFARMKLKGHSSQDVVDSGTR